MMKRLLPLLLLAGLAAPSTGCHCLSQLLCCDTMGYAQGGCDLCGGAGCAACEPVCENCGGAGCAMCGGHAGCATCFPILSHILHWVFYPCDGCENLYNHGPGCGCDACAAAGPVQPPYNVNPYMDGMPYDGEMMMTPQEAPPTPTPAAQPMTYRAPSGVSRAAYQTAQPSAARAGDAFTATPSNTTRR